MENEHFNLITDPWIKVINDRGEPITVSMATLFDQAKTLRSLAGETKSQDLAVMRLLLAVLQSVYTRFDAEGDAYDWLNVDSKTLQVNELLENHKKSTKSLMATWQTLHAQEKFSGKLKAYLQAYQPRFDFFGERPFYQATQAEYDRFTPGKKHVATGTGTVAVKQINRLVSESANTPAIFAPKAGESKDQLAIAEFVRWIIAYQNYTGVTDKTKIDTSEKFSTSPGWLYKLNPVFAQGRNLLETLLLNLVLDDPIHPGRYHVQRPVWEFESTDAYIEQRKHTFLPDNVAEIYTAWSRLLHIQWDDDGVPTIFSAGIPMFDAENAFIEPMTTWRIDKKAKPPVQRPATKYMQNLDQAMWRHFGQYIRTTKDSNDVEPGIVKWLNVLRDHKLLPQTPLITLASVALISDGNATSQSPAAEFVDDLRVNADVLFDTEDADWWPTRIEETIELTQEVAKAYWQFANNVATLRNLGSTDFAKAQSARLYEALNRPFKAWLASLSNQDERDPKVNDWKQTLRQIVYVQANAFQEAASPREMQGKQVGDNLLNIFTATNTLHYKVDKLLEVKG